MSDYAKESFCEHCDAWRARALAAEMRVKELERELLEEGGLLGGQILDDHARIEQAEAACAAMRAMCENVAAWCARGILDSDATAAAMSNALASDAGRALLDRLRAAETELEKLREWVKEMNRAGVAQHDRLMTECAMTERLREALEGIAAMDHRGAGDMARTALAAASEETSE